RVGVTIPLRNPRPDGLPDKVESERLQSIEDALIAASKERAILVAVITTSGMRKFVFYTETGDWIPDFHQQMMRSTSSHEVQCMAQHDPDWTVYHQLGGWSRRCFDRSVLRLDLRHWLLAPRLLTGRSIRRSRRAANRASHLDRETRTSCSSSIRSAPPGRCRR